MDLLSAVATDSEARRILQDSVAEISAAEGSVLLLESDSIMRFVISISPAAAKLEGLTQPIGTGICGTVMTMQQPMAINDVKSNPDHDPRIDEAVGSHTSSLLAVPITMPNREFGVVTAINSSRANGFRGDDLDRFIECAARLAFRFSDLERGTP